jgi:drug/metabolite transporter (DMT)-like permease
MADRNDIVALIMATLSFSLLGIVIGAISLSGLPVAGGRALFALPACWIWALSARRRSGNPTLVPDRGDWLRVVASGLFLTGNWLFYALAIKQSSVSIAVVALFTYPLITALLEPIVTKTKLDRTAALAGIAVVAGVALLAPTSGWDHPNWRGILLGIAAGLSFALRTLFSKPLAAKYHAGTLMAWQFVIPTVLLTPWLIGAVPDVTPGDWLLLALLGAVLTSGALVLFTASLRGLSGAVASIGLSMQPVLSIALAVVLLGERPTGRTLLGAAVITGAVVAVSVVKSLGDRSRTR